MTVAGITLEGVTVQFPMHGPGARSLRRLAVDTALGRRIHTQGRRTVVDALVDIDLELREGDRLALIGPNGAGKTTLLRTLAGVYVPARGRIARSGRIQAITSLGLGLAPMRSGRDNIALLGLHLGIQPKHLRPHLDEIVAWTELGSFIDAPVVTYSAGMIGRLAFAVSTALAPDILLLDEWLAVADAQFQAKAHQRMLAFTQGSSIVVLASHSTDLLRHWCTTAARLDSGRIVERGAVAQLLP